MVSFIVNIELIMGLNLVSSRLVLIYCRELIMGYLNLISLMVGSDILWKLLFIYFIFLLGK